MSIDLSANPLLVSGAVFLAGVATSLTPCLYARGACRNDEAMIDQSAMRRYRIVRARCRDVALLSAIELAAAELLRGHAPDAVLDNVTDDGVLQRARRERRLWVALMGDAPVGFAHVELLEPDAVHLEELDVRPEHGRRGLGVRLIASVCRWAERRGSLAVTLTTFRDVPWNMPFYSRIGFTEIPAPALTPALRGVLEAEARQGLDPARRVAMRWRSHGR